MNDKKLSNIGWKPFFKQQIAVDETQSVVIARVSAHHGSDVILLGEAGEFRVPIQLAEAAGSIAVGDWLVLNEEDLRAVQLLDRQSLLHRKASGEEVKPQLIAANIDTVFIVSSCNSEFNPSRIERYLALALQASITPVVVLTKSDLCNDTSELRRQAEQLHTGLIVEVLDARNREQADVLKTWCGPGQSVALLGSSGVGKSTLAISLGAGDLDTGEIREDDDKGRHTTTSRSLHLLPSGGVLVDNPGIRELQLPDCEEGINELFEDVIRFANECKFRNCSHQGDPGCAVIAAIESGELEKRRLESYQKLITEQTHNSRSLAKHREFDRNRTRMYKSVTAGKRRRRKKK